jgi:hypothetical protein
MYTRINFRSKAELKRALVAGKQIAIFQPGGLFPTPESGVVYLEGPHYPAPHRWYAKATIVNGLVRSVS